ncbi:hypothetical protein JTL62_34070, partial [Pseudomonas aeruginosa]|nr:hypothetical protein [Pseudomonas aeruginosa]
LYCQQHLLCCQLLWRYILFTNNDESFSHKMTPKKFSLIPGNISRFFILMVIVLLATMGVMIQSAVNAWLKEKSYQVVDVSHALHQRIDAWRYATWQIYDNIAATSVNTASGGLQETR